MGMEALAVPLVVATVIVAVPLVLVAPDEKMIEAWPLVSVVIEEVLTWPAVVEMVSV